MLNPIQLKFLAEKYEKENKHFKLHETFQAVPGLKPVSGKFYAKQDVLCLENAPPEYVQLVKRQASSTPRDVYISFPPPSANMEYGWFSDPLISRTSDRRFYFPKKQYDFIKTEVSIKEMRKKLPEKKFTGVPFRR